MMANSVNACINNTGFNSENSLTHLIDDDVNGISNLSIYKYKM